MRKVIDLPHKMYDYNCMISGLEDMVEQKMRIRLPEYSMFFGSFIGFRYEVYPQGSITRRVEAGYGIGEGQYQFLSEIFGFQWHASQGQAFGAAWEEIRGLIDLEKPVILGDLDMFHLPYLKKFYHRIHVPGHYITLVGYDDARGTALAQDCGREQTAEIPLVDLQQALAVPSEESKKPNTFFWFDFDASRTASMSVQEALSRILRKRGATFLHPPDRNQGVAALRALIADFPEWQHQITPRQLNESLKHMVTYTCSLVPMPPQRLVFFPIDGKFKSHQSSRDRFAALLKQLDTGASKDLCCQAARLFEKSGVHFQNITDLVTGYLVSLLKTKHDRQRLEKIPVIFEQIAEIETQAFSLLARI